MVLFLYSCKKETCPAPIPGKVIDQDVIGEYGACIEAGMTKNYNLSYYWMHDSSGEIDISVFNIPTTKPIHGYNQTSIIDSIYINGHDFSPYGLSVPYYSIRVDSSLLTPSNYFANYFKSINYKIQSSKYGIINYIDNRTIPNFTNFNSIPLSFSNSSPYTLSLTGVTNCNLITAYMSEYLSNDVSRSIPIINSTTKFYPSEFFNTAVGQKLNLSIELISEKDTVIFGCKIKTRKAIRYLYQLTCVP